MNERDVGALLVCDDAARVGLRRGAGIVWPGDLAMRHPGHVAAALRRIPDPSTPDRPAN